MVQTAPSVPHAPEADEAEHPYISPTRGGGHPGHVIAIFLAAHAAPIVAMVLSGGVMAGGMGATWWLWTVVALLALPAFGLFAGILFLTEHGLEVEPGAGD